MFTPSGTLSSVVKLSYPILLLGVFASQLCLPFPAAALLMLAGALARSGQMDIALILGVGVIGCLGGDIAWFEAGRVWGSRILRIVCGLSGDPQHCSSRAHRVFGRWGLRSLLLAKFIPGYNCVAPPLAGMEGTSRIGFLIYDSAGSLLWSAVYTGIGYLFAARLALVTSTMARFGELIGLVIGMPLLAYVTLRAWRLLRMLRYLRLRKMTPQLLYERHQAGENIVVLDLLNFEEELQGTAGIPGAVRIDVERLRSKSRVVVPDNLDIVLYCNTSGELTSARVALSLRKKGVFKVWILDGGLTAWKNEGFPVTPQLSTGYEAAARLGIRIIE